MRALREVVGANVKRIRSSAGVTAERLSKELKMRGLSWSANRVSELENGTKAVGVAEILMLAHVLSVNVPDLFEGDYVVTLTPEYTISGHHLREAFMGNPVAVSMADFADVSLAKEKLRAVPPGELKKYRTEYAGSSVIDVVTTSGEAEAKAAKALGISEWEMIGASARIWGHSLSAERDYRAGQAVTKQMKGHITRSLMSELRNVVGHGDD